MKFFILILFCSFVNYFSPVHGMEIIPYPSSVVKTGESFSLKNARTIYYSPGLETEAEVLAAILADNFKIRTSLKKGAKGAGILLTLNDRLHQELGNEGYQLTIGNNNIRIDAARSGGIFYGIQTLKQILNQSAENGTVAGLRISDKPRFGWRAFMLDEARYFKGINAVKNILDEMARLKLNTFHWHLTDDAGWRIEIKKYPLLTQIGSKRDSSQVGVWPSGWSSKEYDGKPHEGFYTQDQIKEIIQYAQERHIIIVPEIEMPGHSAAAIAAYPWLGAKDTTIKVPVTFGVQYDVYNVADERVRNFLKDVLDEVMELFPSKVIHIGGDEVRHNQWKESALVNEFMKKNEISSPAELQVWFTNEISRFVESKGRRMMGWNEIMGTRLHDYVSSDDVLVKKPLAKNTIVHFWKGDLDLIRDAVEKGHTIVNSFHEYTYLDYHPGTIPLDKSYRFDPVPEGLSAQYHDQILGLGAQMWGEWIPTVESMNDLIYPRLAAYAEVGWTKAEHKDFKRFSKAVEKFYD